jgi:capsular exopolysaccharide synthesis family protein
MERIQKALNKAREQREGMAQGSAGVMADDYAPPVPAGDVPGEIEYSQTRKVAVSEKRLKAMRVVANAKGDPHADLFRVLRTKVLHRMRKDGVNTLAVTSPTKGSGKSMIAANLAVSLSLESNHTVMLVDLDLRRPSLHKTFSFEPERGLSDYLLEGAGLPDLLVNPGIERLVVLPVGKAVEQSSELLSTPRMANLVEDITNRYAKRIIIFDLPPLLHMDDALAFLPQVQSTLLVVEEGVNTPAEVTQSLHLLENSHLLGTVLNKAQQLKHSPY